MTTCPGLFTAHDTGLIALPPEIVKLRDAHHRAEDHLRELTAPPHHLDARDKITAAAVDAFIAGAPLPDIAPVLDAERESRAFEHGLEVARNAAAALNRRTGEAVADAAEEIVADVLRPVFEQTTADLREAYLLLEPFEGAGRAALALAEARVRKAAGVTETAGHAYTVLTQAAREARALTPAPQYDVDNEFATWRDIHTVWPRERRTNFGAQPAPWESVPDPFAWQMRNLTAWLPTAADQDAEWLKVYGQALTDEGVRNEKRQAMASVFGQGH